MPQELPGFYYDAEKNRYFPLKGPIPGSQCPRPSASSSTINPQKPSSKHTQVWKYQRTKNIGDGALELIHVDKNTLEGQSVVDFLVSGGVNGYLSYFEVGKVGQRFDNDGIKCLPDCVWPVNEEDKTKCSKAPGHIWRAVGVPLEMPSSISCMKLCGWYSHSVDSGFNNQQAMYPFLMSVFI